MKKKVIIISIIILLVTIISINSTSKDQKYLNQNKIKENKAIAVYLENEPGKYTKTTTIPNKEDKYILNVTKSVCNGNTNISWNEEEWGLELSNIDREETKCYLYFDKGRTIEEIIPTLNAKTEQPDFSKKAESDEGVFEIEDGMYGGTSYYWRGASTTNYLKFGGFCWRIVRINGDKTVRVIYDGTTCHQNGESTTDSIAVTKQAYNENYNNSTYVGWTYIEGKQRPEVKDKAINSNAKEKTEDWYNTNLISYNDKIADGKYCNDREVNNTQTWSENGASFAYAGYSRIYETFAPILSCHTGDVYTLKVGAITVDEAMLAGGKGENNNNYYLYNGQNYWTASPYNWIGNEGIADVYIINLYGNLNNTRVNSLRGIRPVINLKSDILLAGEGTIDNPYYL